MGDLTQGNLAQLVLKAIGCGELSAATGQAHVAHEIGNSPAQHHARPYVRPNEIVARYVEARVSGLEQRDPTLAKKNGEWVRVTMRVYLLNRADYELLEWAKAICEKAGSAAHVRRIEHAMKQHLRTPPPSDYFKRAIEAQRMDSEDARRTRGDQ